MIPDAHCHLDQLADSDRAVEEAAEAGVTPLLAVSMDAAAAESILRLRQRHAGRVLAGIGLHPSSIVALTSPQQERELRRLEPLLPEADFIGEIGLDYKDASTEMDRQRQREALATQLAWAESRRLPLNMHSRRADRDVLNVAIDFRERTGLASLLHWFTHSTKLARACAQQGIYISPGPSILVDPKTAAVARDIEDSILLIETDSPVEYGDLGAARPVWALRVLARLAELRGVEAASLGSIVRRNLGSYLGRSLPG